MMARLLIQAALLILSQLVWLESVHANHNMTLNGVTWDDSCTQQKNPENKAETKQAAVQRAWAGALELIDSAWTRFEQTHAILVKTQLDEADQKAINKHDPA